MCVNGLAAIKGFRTSARVPEQDILDLCSSNVFSFKTAEEFTTLSAAVLNHHLLAVEGNPEPARHLVLLRVVEGARCESDCFVLQALSVLPHPRIIDDVRSFAFRVLAIALPLNLLLVV